MTFPKNPKMALSRRTFLKLTALAGGSLALNPVLPSWAGAQEPGLPFAVSQKAVDPLGVEPDARVDAAMWEAGYGLAMFQHAAEIQSALHPGTSVVITPYQTQTTELQARFIAGEPPDVIYHNGLNLPDLASQGLLLDLAPLLSAPALDTPGATFRDTLLPVALDPSGSFDGKQYALFFNSTIEGVHYSGRAFREAGYTYPNTWAEMLALSEQIKQDGQMYPWTYAGIYPNYLWNNVWATLVSKAGGPNVWLDIDNLEPNAWAHPAVLRATEDVYALADRDLLLPGTLALDHTESQAAWLRGEAMFLPVGDWVFNEMGGLVSEGGQVPNNFDMVVARVPGYDDTNVEWQNYLSAGPSVRLLVPSTAQHPVQGMEFIRSLFSKHVARQFMENTNSVTNVKGADENADISTVLQSALNLLGTSRPISARAFSYYSGFYDNLSNLFGQMMSGALKPQDFLVQAQRLSDDIARDPTIEKNVFEPL